METRIRKDVARNNRAILKAASDMIRNDPASLSIAAVAQSAGLSVSTVYRHYPSAKALLGRFMVEVDKQIRDFSHECQAGGIQLFDEVIDEWGRIIATFGPGLVQIRSRQGFFERLDAGDEAMEHLRSAWERPILRVFKTHRIDERYFDSALFLLNMLFDPRELLDLTRRGMTMPEAVGVQKVAFLGAVQALQSESAIPSLSRQPSSAAEEVQAQEVPA